MLMEMKFTVEAVYFYTVQVLVQKKSTHFGKLNFLLISKLFYRTKLVVTVLDLNATVCNRMGLLCLNTCVKFRTCSLGRICLNVIIEKFTGFCTCKYNGNCANM